MSVTDDDLSRLKIQRKEVLGSKRRARFVYPVVLVLLVAGGALLYSKGFFRGSVLVRVASVSKTYPSQSFSLLNASGYVVAQRKAAVASKVTGRLVEVLVEEGDAVKKDQVIAKLENEDAASLRDQAVGNLAVARAALEEAKAGHTEAALSYERTSKLYAGGAVSKSSYDTAEARYRGAEAAVSSAQAAIMAASASVRAAEVGLNYTNIRAPFDAVVLTKDADVGDIVTPLGAAANSKAAVFTIADLDSLRVEVDVSETNLAQVSVGQPCEIQLDALPDTRFRGKLHAIVPTADRTKASIQVKVSFVDRDPRVLPEMSAKVIFLSRPIEPEERRPYVAVHRSAVLASQGERSLFLVREGKAVEVPVRIGREFGDMLEVLDGAKVGDMAVLDPPEQLKHGSRIKIAEK